jgi:quercetin dioxygenase-like cupin family protein
MRPTRRHKPIQLQFDRIPPGVTIGPHTHGVETVVYLAAGEVIFEYGADLEDQLTVRAGDVLYEAPGEYHLIRNEGRIDALALLAAVGAPSGSATNATDDPPGDLGGIDDDVRRWDRSLGQPVRRGATARVVETPGMRHRVLVEPGDFGTATFTVGEIELAPGASTGWHRHQAAEHVIVVFEGRGTVRVGALEETLEPLKGVRIEMGLPHAITNTGRKRLRYYLCATPAADPLSDREELDPPV